MMHVVEPRCGALAHALAVVAVTAAAREARDQRRAQQPLRVDHRLMRSAPASRAGMRRSRAMCPRSTARARQRRDATGMTLSTARCSRTSGAKASSTTQPMRASGLWRAQSRAAEARAPRRHQRRGRARNRAALGRIAEHLAGQHPIARDRMQRAIDAMMLVVEPGRRRARARCRGRSRAAARARARVISAERNSPCASITVSCGLRAHRAPECADLAPRRRR